MAYLTSLTRNSSSRPRLSSVLCFCFSPVSLLLPPLSTPSLSVIVVVVASVVAFALFAMFLVMYKHETNLVNNYTPSSTLPTNSTASQRRRQRQRLRLRLRLRQRLRHAHAPSFTLSDSLSFLCRAAPRRLGACVRVSAGIGLRSSVLGAQSLSPSSSPSLSSRSSDFVVVA